MKGLKAVFKREFKAYFDSPVAYVFLTAFLVLMGFMTFGVAMFYERRQADLTPFFFWHPWVYLLLVPAATMGLWADERRNGTAELLLTLPVTVWEVIVGKFLAAWSFIGIALALTVKHNAGCIQVIDLVKGDVLGLHLLPDGIARLDTHREVIFQPHVVKAFADGSRETREQLVAPLLAIVDR